MFIEGEVSFTFSLKHMHQEICVIALNKGYILS